MRRTVCLFLVLSMLCLALVGCQKAKDGESRLIVCTGFAAYDWMRELIGDDSLWQVSLLVADGSDLHSYQPTVADKVKLVESALVIRIGGVSDAWVAEMADADKTLCLSEVEGVTLRTAEALHDGHGHDHEHEHVHEEGDGHDHAAFDEHLWLSPKNAQVCVTYLAERLCALDAENADRYRARATAYSEKLATLDKAYAEAVATAPRRELLVADRFPFVYLVEDYGLSYCAAFAGCSTESRASFDTVIRLARQADEWNLSHILVTESSDGTLAESVIRATQAGRATVLDIDSMQAVSAARVARGAKYLSIMYENLEILKCALA